jgi:hypothetical protein
MLKSVVRELDDKDSEPAVDVRSQSFQRFSSAIATSKQTSSTSANSSSEQKAVQDASGEWTHPLIVELLNGNPSLREYVNSRSSKAAATAGDGVNASLESRRRRYELSSSSSQSSTGSSAGGEGNSESESDRILNDSFSRLLRASAAVTVSNVSGSPARRVTAEATVNVGPSTGSPLRSPTRGARPDSAPGSDKKRVLRMPIAMGKKASGSKRNADPGAEEESSQSDTDDEEILDKFQAKANSVFVSSPSKESAPYKGSPVRGSPPKAASPVKNSPPKAASPARSADLGFSPRLTAEARRRRKHKNTPYDDSSSAGNKSEEDLRKERHKNAPHDDSSTADNASDSERLRRSLHKSAAHDDSTSAGNRSEEERRKQRHNNVPYDDSSTAGEHSEEERRKLNHRSVPYDDSSSADDDVPEGWNDISTEELIRRKYRSEALAAPRATTAVGSRAGASPSGGRAAPAPSFVNDDDEDYAFASAVVKYWDQLLLGPPTDASVSDSNAPASSIEAATAEGNSQQPRLSAQQSFNTSNAVGPSSGSSTQTSITPLERSGDEPAGSASKAASGATATFEEFQSMSAAERQQYLYGTIESSYLQTDDARDFSMVREDIELWSALNNAHRSDGANQRAEKSISEAEQTNSLRAEIFELAKLLGIDPVEFMASTENKLQSDKQQSAREKQNRMSRLKLKKTIAAAQQRSPSAPAAAKGASSSPPSKPPSSKSSLLRLLDLSPSSFHGDAQPSNSASAPAASSIGGKVPDNAKKGKKKAKKTKKSKNAKKTKKNSGHAAAPPLMPPVSSLRKSPSVSLGLPRASSARDNQKDRNSGRTVTVVVNRRKSGDGAAKDPLAVPFNDKGKGVMMSDPPRRRRAVSPPLHLESPAPLKSRKSVSGGSHSVSRELFTSQSRPRIRETLDDTNIVVVNNTPYYPEPSTAAVRPRSAPPRRSDVREVRPVRRRAAKQERVSRSLAAPTMSSIARTNETLTRSLEFLSEPRVSSVPWDKFSFKVVSPSTSPLRDRKQGSGRVD